MVNLKIYKDGGVSKDETFELDEKFEVTYLGSSGCIVFEYSLDHLQHPKIEALVGEGYDKAELYYNGSLIATLNGHLTFNPSIHLRYNEQRRDMNIFETQG